ncbi:4-hydroxy-2-oxovalerate aldolase, partial [Acinetobacter baumannii]
PVVVDTTLRDGSHAHRHQYTVEEAQRIAQALDEAGVYAIEVSHGDGLGGSSIQYGFSRTDEMELIRAVRETVKRAKVA